MREALKDLTKEQIAFICSECGITQEQILYLDEDELYDQVYDVMCDIECAEIPVANDEKESERCVMASDIVTILGNTLAVLDDEED